jgi:hypothetical protein
MAKAGEEKAGRAAARRRKARPDCSEANRAVDRRFSLIARPALRADVGGSASSIEGEIDGGTGGVAIALSGVTLCFTATQALLAAKAGAAYISPFIGRLDDISTDGMQTVKEIVQINFATEVLVASDTAELRVVTWTLALSQAGLYASSIWVHAREHNNHDSDVTACPSAAPNQTTPRTGQRKSLPTAHVLASIAASESKNISTALVRGTGPRSPDGGGASRTCAATLRIRLSHGDERVSRAPRARGSPAVRVLYSRRGITLALRYRQARRTS